MSKKKSSNGAAAAGKRPEGVKVIPLSFRDQYNPIDKIRSLLFFVVRRRLDEALMRRSLETLIREHVPILGARLETAAPSGPDGGSGGGGLEYHLPEGGFPEGYELFAWSSETVGKTFAEAGVLPPTPAEREAAQHTDTSEKEEENKEGKKKGKKMVEFYPSVPELEARWTPSSWPRERRHDRPGGPLLLVHLTRYADATVVSTNLPHAVSDQKGYAALVSAWIEVIKGRQPRPFLDLPPGALMGDPDISVADMKKKDPRGVYRITSRKERARTALGFAMEVLARPREVRRTLVFDEGLVSRLRDKFNGEIAEEGEESGGVKVTNGDVITAILLKFGHLDRQKPKMITHSAAVNLRGRHPSLPDSPSSAPYLYNAVTYLVARFPVSASSPRARDVARRNREATLEAVTRPRAERGLAVMREMARRGYMIHICEPGELSFALTNWCGAWRGIDFSAAVEGGGERGPEVGDGRIGNAVNGDGEGSGGEGGGVVGDGETVTPPEPEPAVPGAAPLVFGHSLERSQPLQRFNCQVMCKADGGYWVDFSCSSKNMALIEALLEKDPGLDTL